MFDSQKQEKVYLLGVITKNRRRYDAEESLEELVSLSATAGALQVGIDLVEVREISPGTFLGKGTVERLKGEIAGARADLVVFDGELSPAQNKNLEEEWDVRVIDRTSLILDIFALHAHSREGKLQVELAQYEYLYPRLVGAWTHFSRQRGGGVGLRGPGETQLEMDRRSTRDKIARLKESLKKVESARQIHRQKRESALLPTVTLVGYTNAGKTTLFNYLSGADQLVEDKLFATLDPKTKKIKLPSSREVLLTDTVGFIRNLPHQLVEAFKSTFEEAANSDLLLHVIDASRANFLNQIEVVEEVLAELGLADIPVIKVFNKMDVPSGDRSNSFRINMDEQRRKIVPVSAMKGSGIEMLLGEIDHHLIKTLAPMKLFLPHPYGQLLSTLYANGRVLTVANRVSGVAVEVALPEKWQRKFAEYVVSK